MHNQAEAPAGLEGTSEFLEKGAKGIVKDLVRGAGNGNGTWVICVF